MLPAEVVSAPSLNHVNAVKNRLDSHWQQYIYRYSQHDAYNLNKCNLERPRSDTGYVA